VCADYGAPMKFSVWPSPARPTAEVLDLAQHADAAGWFGFWFADHYMPNTETGEVEHGDVHEVWSVLPAVAAVTESIRVGPLVAPTSVHHPAVLANRAVTLDHVSNGRMVLGLGAGWQVNEHRAYGIELEEPKVRVDRFEEAIQIVRSLLDEDRTTFAGTHYTITDAPSDPSPIQDLLPIVVGTSGKRMCRITATHAQEWNTWGTPAEAGRKRAIFDAACERAGVDPASMHTSTQAMFHLTDDPERIAKIENVDATAKNSVAGPPERIIEVIGEYAELGFDEIIVPDFTLGETAEERREGYDRFAAEIIPHCG